MALKRLSHFFRLCRAAAVLVLLTAHTRAEMVVQSPPAADSKWIVWADKDRLIVTKERRGQIRIWQADTGALLQCLPAADPMKSDLSVSQDGAFIGAISNGHAVVYQRASGKQVWMSVEADVASLGRLTKQSLVLALPGEVRVVDFNRNEVTATWRPKPDTLCVNVRPLGKGRSAVFLHGRRVVVLDEALVKTAESPGAGSEPFFAAITAVDGDQLALATFTGILMGDAGTLQTGLRALDRKPAAFGAAFSSDGGKVAFGGQRNITVASTKPGGAPVVFPLDAQINALAWSSDGKRLAVATGDKGIRLVEAGSGKELIQFGQPSGIEPLRVAGSVVYSGAGTWMGLKTAPDTLTRVAFKAGNVLPRKVDGSTPAPAGDPGGESDSLWLINEAYARRLDINGKLLETIKTGDDVIDSGILAGGELWLRGSDAVRIHRRVKGVSEPVQSFPLQITRRCVFAADGGHAIHQASGESENLIIREAPDWAILGEVTPPDRHGTAESLFVSPDGKWCSWIDRGQAVHKYDLKIKVLVTLRNPASSGNDLASFTSPLARDWFISYRILHNPMEYTVVSAIDGKTLFESKPWQLFREEADLVPVGVTPDKQHLWMFGTGGRPVLVDLKSGAPVLRLHFWPGGDSLWEMADGHLFGSDGAKKRVLWSNEQRNSAVLREDLLGKVWNREALVNLLNKVLVPR